MGTETLQLHVCREYVNGVGHIDGRGKRFLVSFYGRSTRQAWASTLQEARVALRRLAKEDRNATR